MSCCQQRLTFLFFSPSAMIWCTLAMPTHWDRPRPWAIIWLLGSTTTKRSPNTKAHPSSLNRKGLSRSYVRSSFGFASSNSYCVQVQNGERNQMGWWSNWRCTIRHDARDPRQVRLPVLRPRRRHHHHSRWRGHLSHSENSRTLQVLKFTSSLPHASSSSFEKFQNKGNASEPRASRRRISSAGCCCSPADTNNEATANTKWSVPGPSPWAKTRLLVRLGLESPSFFRPPKKSFNLVKGKSPR